jgi:hypothetical protein
VAVGVYLVSFPLRQLCAISGETGKPLAAGSGKPLLDRGLREAGLGGLGTVNDEGPEFYEKLTPQKGSFDRLCAEVLPKVSLPSLPPVAMPAGWGASLRRVSIDPGMVRAAVLAAREARTEDPASGLVAGWRYLKARQEPQGSANETGDRPLFPGDCADLWLPIPFAGVLVVPDVDGKCQARLTVGSAVEIAAKCQALATAISLDLSTVPAIEDPMGYALNRWRDGQVPAADPGAPPWQRDLDAAFYVALFGSAAGYSIRHNAAVGWSC